MGQDLGFGILAFWHLALKLLALALALALPLPLPFTLALALASASALALAVALTSVTVLHLVPCEAFRTALNSLGFCDCFVCFLLIVG